MIAYLNLRTQQPITHTQPGDVIEVKVKAILPAEGWYAAIEDPLPGNLEALNERLNISSYTAQAMYVEAAKYRYQRYGYNNKEIRDDRVVFFATRLSTGTHTFTYLARVTQQGTFAARPAQVYDVYAGCMGTFDQ